MKTCWVAIFLVILCAIAIGIIGSISYNNDINQKKVIQLREQNEELDFLLQGERDRVKELEEIIDRIGTFTLRVEIK